MNQPLVLVINCGSSSIKFALVNSRQPDFLLSGLAERLGTAEAILHWQNDGKKNSQALRKTDHHAALEEILPLVQTMAGNRLIGIGHRVVHGGEAFSQSQHITAEVLEAVRAMTLLAPLHNPANLIGIEAAQKLFPDLPHVAVFDTAFHQTMPEHAYRYALPQQLYDTHRIRRYGFHGTSHQFVSQKAAQMRNIDYQQSCWLSAHLGNGCSTTAIVNGKSQDTSMGFTPLEGVVMGTRSGDVDPNLHGHLARTLGWSLDKIDQVLNKESGLLGLSGLTNDMRTLEQARLDGHAAATLAIEVFCYRLAKSLAGLSCALPRIDGLIFTGGIGENSVLIREKTTSHLTLLNLFIDHNANQQCTRGQAGEIHAKGSVPILVVPTDEERQIALDTEAVLNQTP
jgi:acetate kinase